MRASVNIKPQPPGRAGELTPFSRGFNAFLTASIPRGWENYKELTFLQYARQG